MGVEQYILTEKIDLSDVYDNEEHDAALEGIRNAERVDLKAEKALLHDRYEVLSEIKTGTLATIYKVKDISSPENIYALKILNDTAKIDQYTDKRFESEFQYLSSIEHDNIVRAHKHLKIENELIFDRYFENTQAFLMDYVDGVSLDELIDKGIDNEMIDHVFSSVLRALHELHRVKIVHRNIKPSSILLGRDGSVKLCDFSLVCDLNQERVTDIQLRLGCPQYRAPEYHKLNEVDPQIDIYAVGIVLSEVLSGKKRASTIIKRQTTRFIPKINLALPRQLLSTFPSKYQYIAKRATRESPTKRYQNADRMMRDFGHPDKFFEEGIGPKSQAVMLEMIENPYYSGGVKGRERKIPEINWRLLAPILVGSLFGLLTVGAVFLFA